MTGVVGELAGLNKYKCEFCKEQFTYRTNWDNHMRQKHPQENREMREKKKLKEKATE